MARVDEVCEAASTDGEFVAVASALGVSAVARVGELCEAASTGGELVVFASTVAGVGEVATDRLFGSYVTPRITKTSTTPVNSAIVPQKSRFALEAGRGSIGSGGGTRAALGGAPHEGQAVASELISLPHS